MAKVMGGGWKFLVGIIIGVASAVYYYEYFLKRKPLVIPTQPSPGPTIYPPGDTLLPKDPSLPPPVKEPEPPVDETLLEGELELEANGDQLPAVLR